MTEPANVIEAMLLRWSDSHNGRTVTLLLPDDGGDHPFRGRQCGPANGERLAISVARISDDETQTPMEVPNQPRPPSDAPVKTVPAGGAKRSFDELSPAQQAGILCNERSFQIFVRDQYRAEAFPEFSDVSARAAANYVRGCCAVDSRSNIIRNAASGRRWDELVAEYRSWKLEAEVVPA